MEALARLAEGKRKEREEWRTGGSMQGREEREPVFQEKLAAICIIGSAANIYNRVQVWRLQGADDCFPGL